LAFRGPDHQVHATIDAWGVPIGNYLCFSVIVGRAW
jgi:hypothetical protein